LEEPWKRGYYNRGAGSRWASFWYPDRRSNPWRRIKRDLQPKRIQDLRDDGIDANLGNYAEYVDREPRNPDIFLVLENLELHAVNGVAHCKCTVCGRRVTTQTLKDCRHINPDLIREFDAIKLAFDEEARRVRT
jgi:hypothetical protein